MPTPAEDTSAERSAEASRAVLWYETMLRIRLFEERVVDLVNSNEISGVTHEYVGQEAVAVGVCSQLRRGDVVTSTHRGHGHVIAKGGQESRMLAELLGRVDGYNLGRGGSMHIADFGSGMYGANGIVGAGVPIACGAAFAFRRQGRESVAVAFFGDGAINQGVVLESFNLARIWRLPVVFVCEDNQYAQTTPVQASNAAPLGARAAGAGMTAVEVDGMDVRAVAEASAAAVARAREGSGPSFLHCQTYRFVGHQTAERLMKLQYRSDAEVSAWRQRDPIAALAAWLDQAGVAEAELAAIDQRARTRIEEATTFARESPWPDPGTALAHAYAVEYPDFPARGAE